VASRAAGRGTPQQQLWQRQQQKHTRPAMASEGADAKEDLTKFILKI